jgi:hypothetical protein
MTILAATVFALVLLGESLWNQTSIAARRCLPRFASACNRDEFQVCRPTVAEGPAVLDSVRHTGAVAVCAGGRLGVFCHSGGTRTWRAPEHQSTTTKRRLARPRSPAMPPEQSRGRGTPAPGGKSPLPGAFPLTQAVCERRMG